MTAITPTETPPLATQQAAGLRALADAIEAHPEVAQHIRAGLRYMGSHVFEDEARDIFAVFVRAMKAHGAKIDKDYSTVYARIEASWPEVAISLQADRETVCERVVVGTETVTRKVKDPAKLAEVPEVEVTEEVERVEWVCAPILRDATEDAEQPTETTGATR